MDERIERMKQVAESGDVNAFYQLIGEDVKLLEHIDQLPFVQTPLHITAFTGNIQFAMEMMFYGDLVRVKGREHITPLHYVVENSDNLDLLDKFLLVCPISIADVAVRNETALHIALKYDNLEAFKFLVRWLGRNCSKNASSSEKPIFNWEDDKW
ncbi:ankyrin repeat-containing protein BDA1 [Quercus suber]|uniref:ankyrin repeat-containing protein BDA1 n=1 Tax=Quercus suber TaxID=58331 RepID=UPI0032DE8E1F